jgi:hypothetical protein
VRAHGVFDWPICVDCEASPSYPDRYAYLDPYLELDLYVPAPNTDASASPRLATLAPRTAIVGRPHLDPGRVEVYYEGWVNGPAQYGDRDARGLWEAGVEHAAGRMVVRYPTVAKSVVGISDLVYVGGYWPVQKRLVVTDEAALTAWLEAER